MSSPVKFVTEPGGEDKSLSLCPSVHFLCAYCLVLCILLNKQLYKG
jgi:hypothetical protein